MIGAMESPESAKILPGLEPASPVTIKLADLLNSECTVADIRYGPEEPTPSQKRCKVDIAIETCNSTGWTALRERLLDSRCNKLFIWDGSQFGRQQSKLAKASAPIIA